VVVVVVMVVVVMRAEHMCLWFVCVCVCVCLCSARVRGRIPVVSCETGLRGRKTHSRDKKCPVVLWFVSVYMCVSV
jgi:hypothetical protein